MFGYVRPPLDALPELEASRFRRAYCGLCHALSRRGPVARWVLNYDFTLLAILLSDGESASDARRCMAHPITPRPYLVATDAMERAADESLILAYWQLRDHIDDSGLVKGIPYRAALAALYGAYRLAADARPDFDARVQEQLARLRALERERCASLDAPADAFAVLLQRAADNVEPRPKRRVLEQIFYHLGRWIYLIDAADDLPRDAVSGNYNPVALRYALHDGRWTVPARRAFALTLDQSVRQITTAFELWDFGVWTPLLERIFYIGLFQVGRAVLDGRFHGRRKSGTAPDSALTGLPGGAEWKNADGGELESVVTLSDGAEWENADSAELESAVTPLNGAALESTVTALSDGAEPESEEWKDERPV